MRLRSIYSESRRNRPEITVQGCIYQVFRRSDTNELNIVVLDLGTLLREVGMPHIGALVTTDENTDLAVIVTNGATREPHQGEFN
jgi:hypothetical protein